MVSADASPATTTALTCSAHCRMASTSASTRKPACACDLRCISAQSESPSEVAVGVLDRRPQPDAAEQLAHRRQVERLEQREDGHELRERQREHEAERRYAFERWRPKAATKRKA